MHALDTNQVKAFSHLPFLPFLFLFFFVFFFPFSFSQKEGNKNTLFCFILIIADYVNTPLPPSGLRK